MIKTNYHTHTYYCDGKDSPEDMILSAIDKGFEILGFSGHSPLLDTDWGMNDDNLQKYCEDLRLLKEKYEDKIEILCGIEHDYYSSNSTKEFDYIIGSVHCLKTQDGFLPLDDSAEILTDGIDRYFDGDSMKLAQIYYETISDIVNKTGCQIVGHLDLITKFDELSPIFDTQSQQYLSYAKNAIRKLAETGVLFELNTGAMTRGLRTTPYPQKELLKFIRECDCDVIINSDCHDRNFLDFGFDKALQLVRECGFKKLAYLSKGEIKYTEI